MTDQPTLTPELVSMAVSTGMLDGSLIALRESISARLEVLENQKRYALTPGDQFFIKDCRPKKWNGIIVTFVKNDGIWIVCTVDPAVAQSIGASQTVRLRTSHVGSVIRKQA